MCGNYIGGTIVITATHTHYPKVRLIINHLSPLSSADNRQGLNHTLNLTQILADDNMINVVTIVKVGYVWYKVLDIKLNDGHIGFCMTV